MRVVCRASLLALVGCGRIDFGELARGDASGDGITLDCLPVLAGAGPSCALLAPNCGAGGNDSCCASPPVCGGSFYRGFDAASDGAYNDTLHPATISTFRLDRYEVTVGRFRAFVDAGAGTSANPPATDAGARTLNGMPDQAGWDPSWNANLAATSGALELAISSTNCGGALATWTDTAGSNENMPINCISWFEAMAFCIWDGGFLPTEAEATYAASGGTLQRAYPWSEPSSSTTIDCTRANAQLNTLPCNGPPPYGLANNVGSESPLGDGAWGHADLAGNVWEWVLDWSAPSLVAPCTDCANLTPASMRVFRGGGFNVSGSLARGAARYLDTTDNVMTFRHPAAGVRCARTGS